MGWKSVKFLSGKTERPVTEPEEQENPRRKGRKITWKGRKLLH